MVSPMRTSTALSVVRDNCGAVPVPAGASVSERIRHLQAEARLLAREQIEALENALLQIERLSCEIADGGEASDTDIDAALEAKAAQLAKEGF